MTEQEVKQILNRLLSDNVCVGNEVMALNVAITALEEIQQYRELMQMLKEHGTALDILNGDFTIDDLLKAIEKQIPKKPVTFKTKSGKELEVCPCCNSMAILKFCPICGQAID